MMFPHRNIHEYTWTPSDGKTEIYIAHILLDMTWHSNILDIHSVREADCDTGHYLVAAKVGKDWQ